MDKVGFQKGDIRRVFAALQEFFLIVFIVLSPIYKCFAQFTIAGLNPITIIIGLLLICYAVNIINVINSRQQRFFSLAILVVFCVELLIATEESTVGWVLSVLLYAFFLQTDTGVSINKMYKAFLVSSIVAAVFSVSVGLANGEIARAAAFVDGSIAPIAITIILFCDTESQNTRMTKHDVLRFLSLLSSIIVLVFGMSRARILIVAICFLVYGILGLRRIMLYDGKVSRKAVFYVIIALLFTVFLFVCGAGQKMLAPILNRFFREGLDSMGRNVENEFALGLFRENWLFGGGWGHFVLQDLNGSWVAYNNHCAYIAVLARGGLALAIPTFLSYCLLFKKAYYIRKSSKVAWVMMLVFLLLSYGNAGMFNYTICSLIPLVVLDIKKELYHENK